MDDDSLALIKKIKAINSLEELEEAKELGDSFLRKQKRMALLTLLAISEELGKEEILESIRDLAGYVNATIEKEDKK